MAVDITDYLTRSTVRPKNLYLARLLEEGTSTAPIQSHWQGLARALQGGLAGLELGMEDTRTAKAEQEIRAARERRTAALQNLPGLNDTQDDLPRAAVAPGQVQMNAPPPAPPSIPAPSPGSPHTRVASAFGDINAGIKQDLVDPQGQNYPPAQMNRPFAQPGQPQAAPGMTPAGATPVRTESYRQPPPSRGIDPQARAVIRGLVTSGDPKLEEEGIKMWAEYMKPKEPQLVKLTMPNGEEVSALYDPRLAPDRQFSLPQVPGASGGGQPQTVQGPKGPVEIPPGLNKKQRDDFVKTVLGNTADVATGKLTESQSKDTIFTGRMTGASKMLTPDIETEGLNLGGHLASKVPGGYGSYAQNEKRQQYDSAKFMWVSGALRKESGAAIVPFEWDRYDRTFFPQPGDGPKVVEQKRQARALAEDLMAKGIPVDVEAAVRERMPGLPSASQPASQGTASQGRARAKNKAGDVVEWDGKAWVPVK